MFKMLFHPCRHLLLLVLLAGATLSCLGQDDIDFSVAPALVPALTNTDTNTAPVTTLAIDLLAPQRSFTYDGTGANILASSLNPSVMVDLLSAESETDTAIRDSVQTGQISPYNSGGSHLSTLFSRIGSSTNSGAGNSPQSSIESTSTSSNMDYEQSYGTNSDNSMNQMPGSDPHGDQSSWGATSASSWGVRSSTSVRSGAGSTAGNSASPPLSSGYQSGSSLSGDQSSGADDAHRSMAIATIGWKSTGLTVSRSTSNGIAATFSKGSTGFGAASTNRYIAGPGQSLDPNANPSISAASQSGSDRPQQPLFEQALTFSPSVGSAPGSSSPFRSFGETDFLHPNILGASTLSLAAKRNGQTSSQTDSRYKLKDQDNDNAIETSALNDRLSPVARSSRSSSTRRRAAKRTNPFLIGNSPASGKSSN